MLEVKSGFVEYLSQFGETEKRSMFGGTGFFVSGAMFALVKEERIYLRGGADLTDALLAKECKKFVHVKKSSTAIVNYYDITDLYDAADTGLDAMVKKSVLNSVAEKEYRDSKLNKRLRDLPNLRLTIERMLKKAGIEDVDTFFSMSPEELFRKVQEAHGYDVDIKLLWMFAGAQTGVHYTLLSEETKQNLLRAV
ncbi:DNA transformation protein [Enterovibrio norvegicus FF-33]|uniref:DNA transformation protein n=1 Tax=Enterovibrio norvegicus FF-454 TaxID=1185651 RepID=A0A1E5C0X9_9GAMM|nr:TfoX/Sxy family DNA transformation protein [Enterovibrio norvegicus]OEE59157.1 DNA transformation protein [Enterovibrio norvegicus FF-454]OEE67687.1 DNA transformation protein [Enterovibrio norvegicus FF-33]OEE76320.1 DNA transformation protein [Enterovibrio norvegicus FF-162]